MNASADPYWPFIRDALPRLLGGLDRERLSPTYGSFDRDHWAWKFRDMPINMMQTGVLPLAWAWAAARPDNPYRGAPRLLEWLLASVHTILDRQYRQGAFDTVGPFTQDHGVTLAMCHTLLTVRRILGEAMPSAVHDRVLDAVNRGTRFAARSSEDYAFISNHQALFALAWLRAGHALGNSALTDRAGIVLNEVLRHQSRDGWFAEYGGPDPGYESLGLHYLAQYQQESPDPRLAEALERSLAFHAWMLQPDGGISGVCGSRHTVQWYPGGFELLAAASSVARGSCAFLAARLARGAMVTPATVDSHNLPILLHSYALASDAVARRPADGGTVPPCIADPPVPLRHFEDSGVVVAQTPHYFAVAALRRGGAISVHARDSGRLALEDAAYVVELEGDGSLWASSFLGLTEDVEVAANECSASAWFGRVRQEVLTPEKFVVLRLLNLTAFRSIRLGAWIRRMIIARLVTGRERGALRLRRRLAFGPDRIIIRDTVTSTDGPTAVRRLVRTRGFTAVHMGSARYFHPRDLEWLEEADLATAQAHLSASGEASVTTEVSFGDAGHPAVVQHR